MQAMLRNVNPILTMRGYEGFKFAAASTMVEQPNDVGLIHKDIKNLYKKTITGNQLIGWCPTISGDLMIHY